MKTLIALLFLPLFCAAAEFDIYITQAKPNPNSTQQTEKIIPALANSLLGYDASKIPTRYPISTFLQASNNLSDVGNTNTALGNLGATIIGKNILFLASTGTVRFIQINSDGSVSQLTPSSMLSAIGGIDGSSLNADNLTSGTVPDARFPAVLPAIDGSNLTSLTSTNILGIIPIANLATGTPTGAKFIRDDGTLAVPPGSGGTVTSVSVVTANGVSGSVSSATTTPQITLTLGAITPSSVAASGSVTGSNLSGTNTGDQTTISGNAGTATALQTGRTFSVSTDATGTSSAFNGTANVTIPVTLATVNSNVGAVGGAGKRVTFTVNAKGLITAAGDAVMTSSDVGLGNVTNDAQTKEAIMPNTTPSAGQIAIGDGSAYVPQTISGHATISSSGVVTLANTTVVAGTYTHTTLTVDAQGRITAASNGVAGAGDVVGPATNTNLWFPRWNGANSKTLSDGVGGSTGSNGASDSGKVVLFGSGGEIFASTQINVYNGALTQHIDLYYNKIDWIAPSGGASNLTLQPASGSSGNTTVTIPHPGGAITLVYQGGPLGTPSTGDGTNLTNTVAYGIKTATTTVSVSGATAPSAGQVMTATSSTAGDWEFPTTIATEQATTSGTSKDFTGIPADVRHITVMFVGVSTNGTSNLLIQIGDSGGIETTGYVSDASSMAAAGTTAAASTAGFVLNGNTTAASVHNGAITISLEDSSDNTWAESGILSRTAAVSASGGSKATSAVLDRVRITTVNGTDAFDAGVISISYTK